jgi:uncharacterized damage-inducible protein DinB
MITLKEISKELEQESVTTEKMLSRIPDDRYDWQPHQKSMTIRQLATHIAELPSWISLVLNTSELDFATNPYEPKQIGNTKHLLQYLNECLTEGRTSLESAGETQLADNWTMRNGESIYAADPKAAIIRMCLNQIVHHRAQLGVYLRLLNVPIPGSYGPSADEQGL